MALYVPSCGYLELNTGLQHEQSVLLQLSNLFSNQCTDRQGLIQTMMEYYHILIST